MNERLDLEATRPSDQDQEARARRPHQLQEGIPPTRAASSISDRRL